jgi:CheY-like chemotaxis protein
MMVDSLNVLVADDSPEICALVAIALRRFGHRVVTCTDGEMAVSLSQREPFDVIVLDHRMPRMDGLTAARLIREAPATRHVPLVSISASERGDLASEGDVFDCHIPKPLSPREFAGTVQRLARDRVVG